MNFINISKITTLGRVRLLGFLIVGALIFSLASIFLLQSDLIQDWENRFQSRYYLLRSHFSEPVASDLPLILVLVDDHSLPVNSARSPINRSWLANIVDKISEREPTLIAMNILLDRPGIDRDDQKLRSSIAKAGNVILRADPFYPVYPLFSSAALDKGTLKFRLDSSDTIQEVCASDLTCQSPHIFYKKIIDYYQFATGIQPGLSIPEQPWLKINFSVSNQESNGGKMINFPLIRAHEVAQLPEGAFKDKIVLIGTGFPDLYPLYRVPLTTPEIILQETEVVAQVLQMIASNNYLEAISEGWTGLGLFLTLIFVAIVLLYRGVVTGVVTSLLISAVLFVAVGWSFAFHNLELPFVLPTAILAFFTTISVLVYSIQERIYRLSAEISLKQAKIDFLTNELHSHHLFNEFSRLSVMIQQDPKSAKEYLVEFAEMLRSSLKYGDQALVAVEIQVEYLQSYIKQQQLVFGKQLSFVFNRDEGIQSIQVPWHTFFPLVENAVKYSGALVRQKGIETAEIEIGLSLAEKHLVFSVKNPFDTDVETVSSKTGLKNLRERLNLAYPEGGYQLDFKHDNQLWIAELRLPIQTRTG